MKTQSSVGANIPQAGGFELCKSGEIALSTSQRVNMSAFSSSLELTMDGCDTLLQAPAEVKSLLR